MTEAPPSLSVEITPANLADRFHARAVAGILDAYAREPVGGGRPLPADVLARLIPGLRAQHNARVLLALVDGRPVGVAVCFIGFSTFAARPLVNIHDLAVLPEWRGRGIGRSLLDAVETCARDLGCCKITLEVREDNPRAAALYRRKGFADYTAANGPAVTFFLEKRLQFTE